MTSHGPRRGGRSRREGPGHEPRGGPVDRAVDVEGCVEQRTLVRPARLGVPARDRLCPAIGLVGEEREGVRPSAVTWSRGTSAAMTAASSASVSQSRVTGRQRSRRRPCARRRARAGTAPRRPRRRARRLVSASMVRTARSASGPRHPAGATNECGVSIGSSSSSPQSRRTRSRALAARRATRARAIPLKLRECNTGEPYAPT